MANKKMTTADLSAKNNKPVSLYKFTNVTTLLKILEKDGGFRFSTLTSLNDAFESADN